jgi:PleD family two-component response regulator
LVATADKALYAAKGAGRDRIAIAEPIKPITPNAAA